MTRQELEEMIEELRDKGETLEIELDTIQDEIMIYERGFHEEGLFFCTESTAWVNPLAA